MKEAGSAQAGVHGELPHLDHSERKAGASHAHVGRASSIDGACSDKAVVVFSELPSQRELLIAR